LSYGENPHQTATLIKIKNAPFDYEQLGGKKLSYNNILDIHTAIEYISNFKDDKVAPSITATY
jgi:phosphoribosylaminoimidazolecarboxamide formyltransferase/IMP cyclohydrolase